MTSKSCHNVAEPAWPRATTFEERASRSQERGRACVCRRPPEGRRGAGAWPGESRWPALKFPVESHHPGSRLKPGEASVGGLPSTGDREASSLGRGRGERDPNLAAQVPRSPERRPERAGQLLQTLPQRNKLSRSPIQFPCSPSNPHSFLKILL